MELFFNYLLGCAFLLAFIGFVRVLIFISVKIDNRFALSGRYERSLRRKLGDDIEFEYGLYSHEIEDTIQGALSGYVYDFKFGVRIDGCLYVQAVGGYLFSSDLATDKYFGALSLFICPLEYYTPQIAVRNGSRKKFLLSTIQTRIKNKDLVWCEGEFDKNHDVYSEREMRLDALSILSPEVLDVMQHAPKKADLLLKRNMLYYYIPGNHAPEKIVPELLAHKKKVLEELNDNLYRWGRSEANRDKVLEIHETELAITPKEALQHSRERY